MSWARVVFDVESDGLLNELTRLHCLVLRDVDTGAVMSCTDDDPRYPSIRQGLNVLRNAEKLYGHNCIGFDIPAIQKVYPRWTYKGTVRDTMLVGQMWKADIAVNDFALLRRKQMPGALVGSHSLKAWGYRLGIYKGTFSENADWSRWTKEMQDYCEQDTYVTLALVKLLARARVSSAAVETEHELAFFLAAMNRNGFPLDVPKAEELYAKLVARRSQLDAELRAVFGSWIVPAGEFVPKRDDKRHGYYKGCPCTKVKIVQFKPSSRDHIINRLQTLYGWVPVSFTENDNPAMDEDVMKALPYPEAPKLAEYLLVQKRIGQLAEGKNAWLKLATREAPWGGKLTGMAHVHGRINQLGAVTHRATHSSPNMSATPKVAASKDGKMLWGAEGEYSTDMRNLWTIPRGWVIVGADASGLELRCLAHFMARWDGGKYVKVVLEGRNEDGTDIHSVNRDALGLTGKPGREIAKTFIYAFLYGAGDVKLGSILEPLASEERQRELGADLRRRFLKGLPALAMLIDAVKAKAKSAGYLEVLDGRRISVRSEHAALNSLLQTAGALVCKRWLVEVNRRLTVAYGEQGWSGQWAALIWSHDEVQIACRPEIAYDVARILVECVRHMTDHFAFRCPLDGEAKKGSTWAETH